MSSSSFLFAKLVKTMSAMVLAGTDATQLSTLRRVGHGSFRGSSSNEDISLGHHHGHSKYSHEESRGSKGEFDYYVYSMSYQPEFCREHSSNSYSGCETPEESWEGQLTIHGLWPSNNDGKWPQDCTGEALDTSLITDLYPKLLENWPNAKTSTESKKYSDFWSHEWSKHGTCSGLSEHEYFSAAIENLVPTPWEVKDDYGSIVDKEDLIRDYGGEAENTHLVCNYKGGEGIGFLQEVRVCLGKKEGGKPGERIACPSGIPKNQECGSQIRIASFDETLSSDVM